jgi:hypothetical protein
MRNGLIGVVVLLTLVVGTFMGMVSLVLLPFIGGVVLVVVLIWMLKRRVQGKRPLQ